MPPIPLPAPLVAIIPPRKHIPVVFLIGFFAVAVVAIFANSNKSSSASPGCGLAQATFCDTFDNPAGTGNRSGDMNGLLWGVSRSTSRVNTGQNALYDWAPTTKQLCGGGSVFPDADVRICNGQLVTSVNDGNNDNQTILAAYPKQPWDIAGRTGTATFDVGNTTEGPHAAWPEFWYTDQPVPAPHGITLPGVQTTPRNGFGISIAQVCDQPSNQTCNPSGGTASCANLHGVTVDKVTVVANYISSDIPFSQTGCVKAPSGPTPLNHFEVKLSSTGFELFGTDAGTTSPLRSVAKATFGSALPLTRGLIWIEDVHYNACKFNTQCDHALVWDNVGFDGPFTYRDLTFDVLESKIMNGNGTMRLGWLAPNSTANPLTLTIPGVTNVSQATGALITLTFGAQAPDTAISYSLNGAPWATQPWIYGPQGYGQRTVGFSVPLSQVLTGTNTLRLASSQGSAVANVDLVLVAAGNNPPLVTPAATSVPPASTATPTLTPTPQPSATAAAVSTATATPESAATGTPVPTGTATAIPTATQTAVPTSTPGATGTCTVIGTLNGQAIEYTRPMAFCSNQ